MAVIRWLCTVPSARGWLGRGFRTALIQALLPSNVEQ